MKKARWHLHTGWVILEERNPKLRKLKSFVTDSKAAWYPPYRETLIYWIVNTHLLQMRHCLYLIGCLLYEHPWKDSLEQSWSVPLLIRRAETQETPALSLPLNILKSPLYCFRQETGILRFKDSKAWLFVWFGFVEFNQPFGGWVSVRNVRFICHNI